MVAAEELGSRTVAPTRTVSGMGGPAGGQR
jgi:hypothetical protein